MTGMPRAEIGVIGGSGFYEFLEDAERVHVDTPFGDPSDDLVVGELRGRRVAFVARHGKGHRFPPHLVPYRANLWALRSLGVRQVLAPCAVGSLRRELGPGTVVVVDQVVDRTWGRPHTVYDQLGAGGPRRVRRAVLSARPAGGRRGGAAGRARGGGRRARSSSSTVRGSRPGRRAGGTSRPGWSVVGMTGMPEAAIARELAMCFTDGRRW